MNILEQIVTKKIHEVKVRKTSHPVSLLGRSEFFNEKPMSLRESILKEGSAGVIAEFKRKSPSKGIINENPLADVVCA